MPRTFRSFPILAVTISLSAVPACSRPQSAPQPAAPAQSSSADSHSASSDRSPAASPEAKWLTVDSAGQSVSLALEVRTQPQARSALINGYRNGEARVVVPLGWTVKWNWRNADTSIPHSLVVMVQREKIPLEGGRPALTNAISRMVTEGLQPGATDQTTFVAEEAGWYWLMCGVPSHGLEGEWIELRVDPEAKAPSVVIKQRQ